MKVDFADCEFGCFEPHREIEYHGEKYRAIDVDVTLDNGTIETHTIADVNLENALDSNGDWGGELDNTISYYCGANDGIYSALESITSEEIDGNNDHPMKIFDDDDDNGYYFIVASEWNYPTESGHDVLADFEDREEAMKFAREEAEKEVSNFADVVGDALPVGNCDGDSFIVTTKMGLDDFFFLTKIIKVKKSY